MKNERYETAMKIQEIQITNGQQIQTHKGLTMKAFIYTGFIVLFAIALSACGSIQTPETTVANLDETDSNGTGNYIVDGVPYSPEEMQKLIGQGNPLYYVIEDSEEESVYVFTDEANQEVFIQNRDLSTQGICIATRTKTTVFDLKDYGGASMNIYISFSSLSSVIQSYPNYWDNDITSFKARDCKWTHFYTGTNYTGTKYSVKGLNKKDMTNIYGVNLNNKISSIEVGW